MPSKVMDQRHFSPSFFSEEIRFPVERQVGFWKQDSLPDQRVSQPIGVNMRDQKAKLTPEERESFLARERERAASLSAASLSPWRSLADPDALKLPLNFNGSETGRPDINGTHYENGLFSSSFSDILDKKLRYGSRGMALGPINRAHHQETEDQPFELTSEIEAQTIGDLLPDDDDLLSGVLDEIAGLNLSSLHPNDPNGEDLEGDDDIFFTGGGMEMEGLEGEEIEGGNLGMVSGASPFVGEHPFGEHPSRTLFVRNINSNVEDTELRLLFEQFGDIRTLYTACKHRGFVMISYFDIRSARNAMRTLQNKPLRRRKLDIHYSIPKDNPTDKDANQGTLVVFNLDANVTNDDLHQIFGVYGEIKEIRETPQKCNHKFIEYYDVRAAETALRALNRSDIAGKKIKLEPSRPGGTVRRFQLGTEIEQDEINGCKHGSPGNSPCFGSLPIENGSLQSAIRAASLSPYLESAFPTLSSSTSLSSPIGIMGPTNSSVVGPTNGDLSHSLGQQQNQNHQMNFGFLPPGSVGPANTFHPHSLPEYHHNNGVGNGSLPYNLTALGIHLNSRSDMPKMGMGSAALNAISFDRNEPPFGFSGSGSCPLHGHQQHQQQILLNNKTTTTNTPNSSSYHPLHAGPASSSSLLWSNNTLLPPIPRAPSHLLDSLPPLSHHHHVGSAPSIWDRRHLAESMGFPNSPQLHHHPLETMIMGGMQRGGGASQFFNNVSGRNIPQMLVPNNGNINNSLGFEANERGMRGRRSEAGQGQGDNKKQYELDVDKIMRGEDLRTTLMIKNIPNKYTSKMLLAAIDENHRGTYDFIYLPIDFKNKCNVGYAFINMINPQHIVPFYQTFNGKKWEKFNSEKVASLAYARIQGKGALIAHFQNSSLMNEDKRCRPILFHSHGPNAGDQEPFPMGSNIRSRSGRNRSIGSEDQSQESLSLSTTNLSDNSSPFDPSE